MNNLARISILACAVLITASLSLHAGTSPQEKAFTDKYKTAFEGKDTATLESIFYTQGSDPAILGFYKMMQSGEAGEKISNIELVDLTPDDAKKAATPMDSPTGGKVCLTLKPTKSSSSRCRKKTPTAAQPARPRTSSLRKTASLLFLCRGLVSNSLSSFVVRL
jgi:hypothetical protein